VVRRDTQRRIPRGAERGGDMATKPETLAAMKVLIGTTNKIVALRDRVVPKFQKDEVTLRAAIKGKKRHVIQTCQAIVQGHIDTLAPAVSDLNRAKVSLHDVNEDEEFVAAKSAELLKLSEKLDAAEQDIVRTFQTAKRLQNEAEAGLQAALKEEKFDIQDLAMLEATLKDLGSRAKTVLNKTEALNTQASDAVDARDARKLAQAQAAMKSAGVEQIEIEFELAQKSAAALAEKAKSKELAPDLAADLADGAKDARATLAGISVSVEYAGKNRKRVLDELKIAEIDVKKAAKVLKLEAKFEAKLRKALDGPANARVKALDAIAREARLEDTDGKAMLAELVKQKVVDA
jgi:hypothetical protein